MRPPRGVDRRTGRRTAVAAVLAALTCGAAPALADITVTTTSDTSTPGDGQCSLREAIALSADCPGAAASGTTTIAVPAGTYTLTAALSVPGTAKLLVQGAAAADPAQTTIDRAADAPQFRLMTIAAGAVVTLDALKLSGGHAPDGSAGSAGTNGTNGAPGVAGGVPTNGGPGTAGADGGAILNSGTLTLSHAIVSDNVAGAGGPGGIGGNGGNGGFGTGPSGNQGGVGANGGSGGGGGSGGRGGGIFNGGALTVTLSTFESNQAGPGAPGARGGDGGAGGSGNPSAAGKGGAGGIGGAGGSAGAGGSGGSIYNAGNATVTSSQIRFSRGGMGGTFGIFSAGVGGKGGKSGDTTATFNGLGAKAGDGGAAGDAGPGGFGGGIFTSGPLVVSLSTFSNDSGGDGGWGFGGGDGGDGGLGGLSANGGTPGQAGAPKPGSAGGCGGLGGAIMVASGAPVPLTITRSTLWNNGGGYGGFGGGGGTGGLGGGDQNTAAGGFPDYSTAGAPGGAGGCGGRGGALAFLGANGPLTLTDTTIGENGGGAGGDGGHGGNGAPQKPGGNAGNGGAGAIAGAIYAERSVTLDAATVALNRTGAGGHGGTLPGTGTPNGSPGAPGAAGTITQIFADNYPATFRNTLVRGPDGPGVACALAFVPANQGGNLAFPSPSGGCPGVTADPLLDPIDDYGGPTRTYRLRPGSPGIDGGNDAGCPAVDQRGLARPQGLHCDIGAVEAGSPPVCQDVGPVHVPYGRKTNVQLVCTVPTGFPITSFYPVAPYQQHGEIRVVDGEAGIWSYQPDAGYTGSDTFGYTAQSGDGDSVSRTVTLTVTGPPDAPTVTGVSPASPGNVAAPRVTGTAPAGTTVSLFDTADCAGTVRGSGPAADFAGAGVIVGPLPEGTTTLRARVTDVDGIGSTCSSTSVAYTYDGTAPAVTITSGPDGATTDARPVFGFASPDPTATFACSIDSGTAAFGACTGAGTHQPMTALAPGAHTFRVRATDAAGNQAVAVRAFSVTAGAGTTGGVGGTGGTTTGTGGTAGRAPDTKIVRHPKARVTFRGVRVRVTFTFRSPAKGATFRCTLDRGRPVACRSPRRYLVKAGRHRFTVRAVLKGVADPTPATFAFRAVRRR